MDCKHKGYGTTTLLCRHLAGGGRDLGWFFSHDAGDVPGCWPDAWCSRCQQVVERDRARSEHVQASADFREMCDACYERIREDNWPADRHEAYGRLALEARAHHRKIQDRLRETYPLDDADSFGWDQDTRDLFLRTRSRGSMRVKVQLLGSRSTRTGGWLWAWANSQYPEVVRAGLRLLRERGRDEQLMRIAAAHWLGSEEDAWDVAGVSVMLLRGKGLYRTPTSAGFSYMVIRDIQLSS
jgi:hypothetical protein